MSKCFCRPPQMVPLLDGSQACSCHAQYRHECQARELFQIRNDTALRLRLTAIAERRGPAARNALETTLHQLNTRRNNARAQARQPTLFA